MSFINYPWLHTRKNFMVWLSLDIFIFLFLEIIFTRVNNLSSFNIEGLFFICVWIFSSYITGRFNKLTNLRCEIKFEIFRTLISIFMSLLIIYLSNMLYFDFNFTDYFYSYLLFFPSFSLLFHLIIRDKINKKVCFNKNWIFVGNKLDYYELKKSIDLDFKRNYNFIFYKDILKKELKYIYKFYFIVDEKYKLDIKDEEILKKIKTFKKKSINIYTWSNLYLQRFPTRLFNKKYFLLNNLERKNLQILVKRLGDLSLSIFLLIITSPIILISVILILLEDRHNPFYYQTRSGRFQKNIKVFKLRTMTIKAEEEGIKWSKKNDDRITKIGSILRRTRIDELPQLITVIKGEMSLIGPRPERPEIDIDLIEKIPNYKARYFLLPGLSGWAQVNYPYGASIEDSEMKLSYDLFYLNNFSIFLDFVIFMKTIKTILNIKGAIANN